MNTREYPRNGESLVDLVYEQIVALVNRRGVAGTGNLSDVRLAQSLGVSRTPVRMALARLESEGLLNRVQGKGWVIRPLTADDIDHIFDIQDALESLVVCRAAERISPESAATLRKIVDEMKQAAEDDDLEAWFAADNRFHDHLFDIAGNEPLRRILRQLTNQWYRFRPGYMTLDGGQLPILYEEHRLIAEAIIAGDGALANERVLQHLRHIRVNLVTVMNTVLAPFLGHQL